MAKKPTLDTIESGYQSTASLNSNFTALRDAFDNTLSLDGSTPNAMNAALDLNNNNILNINSFQANSITLGGQTVNLTDIQTLTTIAGDIQRLADIEDGTLDTNAIQEVATIYSDVSTVSGIASNVTTVAGNTTNINTVAGINANVTTVAGISGDVTTVSGISSDVTTVAADGVDIGVVAGISTDVTTVSGINADVTTVSGISANVTTVAGNTTNINTVAGINAAVTTVSGISSDVTTVSGISANVTTVSSNIVDINTVATNILNLTTLANIDSDVNTVAAIASDVTTVSGISANVTTVATNTTNINTVASISTDVSAVSAINTNVTTVAGISGNVTTVAGISTSIPTVAGISTDVTTVAGISGNVTTVAGVSTDVTTVAGISTDVTAVATNNANVTTVAGISGNVTTVAGIASDVSTVAADSTVINTVATAITDVSTVSADIASVITAANDLNEAVSEIETVAASITNVDLVGADITNVNTVAGSISNVNTTAGSISNVNIAAANIVNVNAVAGSISDVNTVAFISSDVTTVAADGADIGAVATDIANVNTVAGSILNINTTATNISDVTTVAGEIGVTGDVTIVAGQLGAGGAVTNVSAAINNVITVSQNLANVNNFAEVYRISANAPTTSLDTGDLWYDTLNTALKVYDGSQWTQGVTAGSGFLPLTGGTMSGDISMAGNDIYTNNGSLQMGTGIIYGNTFSGNATTATKLQSLSTNPTSDSVVFWDVSAGNYAYLDFASLDAGTLDGLNSTQFLRSDAADSWSGKLTYVGINEGLEVAGIRGTTLGSQGGNFIHLYERVNIGYPSGWGGQSAPSYGLSTHGGAEFNVGNVAGAPFTFSGNTVWHAGNDGSGSGLDADQLDGIQASSFLRSDADDIASGDITFTESIQIQSGGGSANPIRIGSGFGTGGSATIHRLNGDLYLQYGNGQASTNVYLGGGGTTANINMQNGSISYIGNIYNNGWFRNNYSGVGLYNEVTTQHFYSDDDDWWNIAGGTAANGLRFRDEHAGTVRGSVYADNTNSIGFLDAGGNWAIKHVNDAGTYFYTDDNTEEFKVGRDTVTGDYGTVQTSTTKNYWGGYSINGQYVFMSDHASAVGIYNDIDNEWMLYAARNGGVSLYYDGSGKLDTTSSGVTVTGNVTATAFYGDGSNLTNLPSGTASNTYQVGAHYIGSGSGGAPTGWDTDGDGGTTPSDALNLYQYGDAVPLTATNRGLVAIDDLNSGDIIGGLEWANNDFLLSVVRSHGFNSRWIAKSRKDAAATDGKYGALVMDGYFGLVYTHNSAQFVGAPNMPGEQVFQADNNGITATAFVVASDIRLKENLVVIPDAVDKVSQLNGYSYTTIDTGTPKYGVVAQEVEVVMPHSVKTRKELPDTPEENLMKTVDYPSLIPLLIEAIKEQQSTIEALEARSQALEARSAALEARVTALEG